MSDSSFNPNNILDQNYGLSWYNQTLVFRDVVDCGQAIKVLDPAEVEFYWDSPVWRGALARFILDDPAALPDELVAMAMSEMAQYSTV